MSTKFKTVLKLDSIWDSIHDVNKKLQQCMLVPNEIHCKYNSTCFVLNKASAVITSMITDRIGRHEVLLPINHKCYNFRE